MPSCAPCRGPPAAPWWSATETLPERSGIAPWGVERGISWVEPTAPGGKYFAIDPYTAKVLCSSGGRKRGGDESDVADVAGIGARGAPRAHILTIARRRPPPRHGGRPPRRQTPTAGDPPRRETPTAGDPTAGGPAVLAEDPVQLLACEQLLPQRTLLHEGPLLGVCPHRALWPLTGTLGDPGSGQRRW